MVTATILVVLLLSGKAPSDKSLSFTGPKRRLLRLLLLHAIMLL